MQRIHVHHSQYTGPWPWSSFLPSEVSCRHCGELCLDPGEFSPSLSMDALQLLRDTWGRPITINSGHRCFFHNHAVGGTTNSQHLKLAFDCACPKDEQARFVKAARNAGFTGIGMYRTFVHLDLGPKREWRG